MRYLIPTLVIAAVLGAFVKANWLYIQGVFVIALILSMCSYNP